MNFDVNKLEARFSRLERANQILRYLCALLMLVIGLIGLCGWQESKVASTQDEVRTRRLIVVDSSGAERFVIAGGRWFSPEQRDNVEAVAQDVIFRMIDRSGMPALTMDCSEYGGRLVIQDRSQRAGVTVDGARVLIVAPEPHKLSEADAVIGLRNTLRIGRIGNQWLSMFGADGAIRARATIDSSDALSLALSDGAQDRLVIGKNASLSADPVEAESRPSFSVALFDAAGELLGRIPK